MERSKKVEMVDMLKSVFTEAGVVLVVHYSGLSVADMNTLRGKLKEHGAALKVIKNRLARIALEGSPAAGGADLFRGPVAILYAADPVAVSKVAVDYAKQNENFLLLGALLGASVLDEEGVKALSKLPSLDELRATLAGVLAAPAGKFVRTVNAPGGALVTALDGAGGNLANVLRARAAQQEAA